MPNKGFISTGELLIEIEPSAPRSLQREALELVLLFHASGHWTDAHQSAWVARINLIDPEANPTTSLDGAPPPHPLYTATTKHLCDAIRRALADLADNIHELMEF